MGGDAYDCTKENVLVNKEPASPHHKSDGVHKDNNILLYYQCYSTKLKYIIREDKL
ncbi:hypothetical protein SDC9_208838 [bioreactor metagenome]|uniref:Uncharacterized protein n=1 Tax=bioreactor metagenome TaxID=1076179 RepID=A0A645JLA5_9ZZZZ